MKNINIDLSEKTRETISQELNKLLSSEFTLYVKTLNYHWNLCGAHFNSLHKVFEKQYEGLFETIDRIAERVRALGFISLGSQQEFLKNSSIKEDSLTKIPSEQDMIKNLLQDHEIIITSIRKLVSLTEESNDHGSANLLADLIESHEKTAWMLRSSIAKSN